ncbi:uncharacterized protein SETTUDRAFT_158426 [Exserohilum turcica Et28A]|uniref:Uncharacterized protein n=1 Tax=Exserohilum turcicum (strain 28A) TaxID=671987 RepID=R0KPG9_EXST2|nr:uncharacterized protein SETTUDRAFT_158426 [Exserohilum turcica Et28A]EOA90939.1 hypothetical protein SETTUDRAFT_158426 [Exserohilum turcica Et28A]
MSQSRAARAIVHKPPFKPDIDRPSVILYGAMSGQNKNWQGDLINSLSDLSVAILDPRRDEWDNTWVEDISFQPFREQVEWEMDYARVADVIAFYFAGEAEVLQPITLLELGLYAGTGKAVVCCPKGFWKRGNVQLVCERYGIEICETREELGKNVRMRLLAKLEG